MLCDRAVTSCCFVLESHMMHCQGTTWFSLDHLVCKLQIDTSCYCLIGPCIMRICCWLLQRLSPACSSVCRWFPPPKPSGFIYSEDEEKWFWLVFLLWLYASEYLSPDSLSWLVHLKIRLFSSIAYGLYNCIHLGCQFVCGLPLTMYLL